jgi:hypothetical protein
MLRSERGERVEGEREDPDGDARRHRRRVRTWSWSAAAVTVVIVVVLFAAFGSSGDGRSAVDASGAETVPTDATVVVTLDDQGVHAAPASTNAGIIQFSLADRRTKKRTGSEVLLYYEVQPRLGGDVITGVGGRVRVLLCPHEWFLVVRVDGVVKGRIVFAVGGTSSLCTTPIT